MVRVLVERMLPSALPNDAQEHLLARMHVRVPVVGLMRILGRIIGVHIVRHRTPVDHEVRGMVRFRRDLKTASSAAGGAIASRRDLRQSLIVNVRVHLGELKKVLPVIAGLGMIVGRLRQPKIGFIPRRFRNQV